MARSSLELMGSCTSRWLKRKPVLSPESKEIPHPKSEASDDIVMDITLGLKHVWFVFIYDM